MAYLTGFCATRLDAIARVPKTASYLWFVEARQKSDGTRHALNVFRDLNLAREYASTMKYKCVSHEDFTVEYVLMEDFDLYTGVSPCK